MVFNCLKYLAISCHDNWLSNIPGHGQGKHVLSRWSLRILGYLVTRGFTLITCTNPPKKFGHCLKGSCYCCCNACWFSSVLINIYHDFHKNTIQKTQFQMDVAPWCYKWVDGWMYWIYCQVGWCIEHHREGWLQKHLSKSWHCQKGGGSDRCQDFSPEW